MLSRWILSVNRLPPVDSLINCSLRSLPRRSHGQSSQYFLQLRSQFTSRRCPKEVATRLDRPVPSIRNTAHVVQSDMGKKKDRKRAREAAAAAAATSANVPIKETPAMSSVSQQDQAMAPLPGPSQVHNQFATSFVNPFWPSVNMALAANGLAGGAGDSMPQMMNGLQSFNMPLLQPQFFRNQQFPNVFGKIIGNMAFSTMQPNMFPGQAPTSAQGHYDLAHTGSPTASPNSKNGRAAITPPSKASGGIPDPTAPYLARASFLPKRRPEPGPLLVVIDLNGTILYRPDRRKSHNFRRRPHADTFIKYCVETFWVVFWSSARPENVRRMVETLVSPELLGNVVAVWGRDRFGLTPEDYNLRTQCYKRLTALWDDPVVRASFPAERPGYEGKCWDQGNTVLIDDSVEKARSEPHNAITIPEFTGDLNESLDILPKVHDYLNELCCQEDVSTYVRAYPFKMA
jgi:hypothetical protein